MRMRAMNARTVGRSAIAPACWNCVPPTCAAVRCTAASIRPADTLADQHVEPRQHRAHHDAEARAVVAEPAPTPARARPRPSTGVGIVAAQAEAVERASAMRTPGVPRGTSHSVVISLPATGLLDHT